MKMINLKIVVSPTSFVILLCDTRSKLFILLSIHRVYYMNVYFALMFRQVCLSERMY